MDSKYLGIALFGICLLNCVEQKVPPKVKYYAKIVGIVSPFMDYNLQGDLKGDTLNVVNYYRVEYDNDSQVSNIAFYKMGKKSEDSYFGTHRVVYHYEKGKLLRQYFNANGFKSNMSRHYYGGGDIHIEEFDLDPSDNKKRLVFKDSTMKRVETGLATYEYVWSVISNDKFIQNQYKKNGVRNYLTAYFPFYKSEITVDHRGYLYSISNIDTLTNTLAIHESAGYAKVLFDFDDYGNEKGWRFYNVEGKLSNRKSFLNMEHGYAQCLYDFSYRNQRLGFLRAFSMRLYDANNQPVNSNLNIHKTHFTINDNDDINAIEYFDASLNKQLHPEFNYHKITIDYQNNGEAPVVKTYDDNDLEIIRKGT
ncbi:hypothetical protein [uncultured Psychroserpens sp.]|uniref:hypothetical protein n=1 Tax=uncultured Psychroserpens sp. TaxID=255436 RepID=UPI0026164CE0|nr:hypothetical protein [uncultured Psychroserpens sp.]